LTWGDYHIEYHLGAYPVPPPGFDDSQEYGSLSAGSKIIEELTSMTYSPSSYSWISIFWPSARETRSPDLVLTDDMEPGQCWPFRGASGQLGIQLSHAVHVLALTVGHGDISSAPSAPKDIALWGLKPINSDFCATLEEIGTPKPNLGSGYCGTHLLSGVYKPSQSTPYQNFTNADLSYSSHYFDHFVVEIKGNWGHPKETCIYRIQVYGRAYDNSLPH
jgi:SUN domain-containing protein 1/2